ncbi:MAG: heme ABC transporter ATP-binding protein [Pseudomonadota bacterium]
MSFTAKAGEITAIIGPNGSGKSTLLNAITGETAYEGNIRFNDAEVAAIPAVRLADMRGVLSQFSSVTFPFTVREMVSLGARAGRFETAFEEDGGIELVALSRVGLEGFGGRKYHELSGGEQQRVQFARVLCQVWQPVSTDGPRWLFLDEPVSSLDIQHQISIMEISRSYAQAGGGVFAIMHDLNLTAMYADHVILLKDGTVLAAGTPVSVLTDENLEHAFSCRLKVGKVPPKSISFVLPQSVNL